MNKLLTVLLLLSFVACKEKEKQRDFHLDTQIAIDKNRQHLDSSLLHGEPAEMIDVAFRNDSTIHLKFPPDTNNILIIEGGVNDPRWDKPKPKPSKKWLRRHSDLLESMGAANGLVDTSYSFERLAGKSLNIILTLDTSITNNYTREGLNLMYESRHLYIIDSAGNKLAEKPDMTKPEIIIHDTLGTINLLIKTILQRQN